jgi:HSP20 family protein
MLTARFQPVRPRTVNELVESVFQDFPAFGVSTRRYPALNAWEDEQALYVEAELPGFRIEDLDINIKANELTISGRRADAAPEGATLHRRERPSGSFTRTVRLGTQVDAGAVSAALKLGVLTITLPKAQAAKARKIDVKVA